MNSSFRQSQIIVFLWVVLTIVFIAVPFWFLGRFGVIADFIYLLYGWSLICFVYCLKMFIEWRFTELRIFHNGLELVKRSGFFTSNNQHVPWNKVSSLAIEQNGIISYLFGLYDLQIYIIGREAPLEIKQVPEGDFVKKQVERYLVNYDKTGE